MKKLLLILVLLSGFAFGQFTVTETSKDWKKVGNFYHYTKLLSKEGKAKIVYTSTSVSSKSSVFEFEFSTESDTLEKLYSLISEKIKSNAIEKTTLDFPEGKMYLVFDRTLFGSHYFMFKFDNTLPLLDKNASNMERDTFPMGQKELDKLFGKK